MQAPVSDLLSEYHTVLYIRFRCSNTLSDTDKFFEQDSTVIATYSKKIKVYKTRLRTHRTSLMTVLGGSITNIK
jgi:hypothetical protein